MNRAIVAVCLAIAPLVAVATIYKVQMPDGRILFTDSPPSGGKILETRESTATPPRQATKAPPLPGATSSRAAERPVAPSASSPSGSTGAGPKTIEAAMSEISVAERELAIAKRKLEGGQEPLPGERIGTANGRSRLSPEYESRIAGLERDVAAAEERVKRAYEAKNALR